MKLKKFSFLGLGDSLDQSMPHYVDLLFCFLFLFKENVQTDAKLNWVECDIFLFLGDNCEVNIDECLSSPCSHSNATCVDGVNAFTCVCPQGLTGDLCEVDVSITDVKYLHFYEQQQCTEKSVFANQCIHLMCHFLKEHLDLRNLFFDALVYCIHTKAYLYLNSWWICSTQFR